MTTLGAPLGGRTTNGFGWGTLRQSGSVIGACFGGRIGKTSPTFAAGVAACTFPPARPRRLRPNAMAVIRGIGLHDELFVARGFMSPLRISDHVTSSHPSSHTHKINSGAPKGRRQLACTEDMVAIRGNSYSEAASPTRRRISRIREKRLYGHHSGVRERQLLARATGSKGSKPAIRSRSLITIHRSGRDPSCHVALATRKLTPFA